MHTLMKIFCLYPVLVLCAIAPVRAQTTAVGVPAYVTTATGRTLMAAPDATAGRNALGATAGVWADGAVSDTLTIAGGTINGVAIGGTTPAAGKFTTLTAQSTIFAFDTTESAYGSITNDNDTWTFTSVDGTPIISTDSLLLADSGYLRFGARTSLASTADGYLLLQNSAGTGFNGLRLGGTTAAFPMLKRNGTALKARLADDSADAPFTAATLGLSTPLTVANGGTGVATLTGIVKGNGTGAFTAVASPTGGLVGDTDTQTLTNKTITTPTINGGSATLSSASQTFGLTFSGSDRSGSVVNYGYGNGLTVGGGTLGIAGSGTTVYGRLEFLTSNSASRGGDLVGSATGVISVENASAAGASFRYAANTPAQLTANQNDYTAGGGAGKNSYYQRWSTNATWHITGLSVGQVDGETHFVTNVGTNNIVLDNQSVSSLAANRFIGSTGIDVTMAPNQSANLIYDGAQSRWLVTLTTGANSCILRGSYGQGGNPVDASSYFGGGLDASIFQLGYLPIFAIKMPRAGVIRGVSYQFHNGVVGSAETSTLFIRINNTTDYTVSTAIQNNVQTFSENITSLNGGAGIPVAVGDTVVFKWVTPTWATNPTGCYFNYSLEVLLQ